MRQTDKLREKILSQDPTSEQIDAIFTTESEFLLRASPGSGKTWTSCRRFIWRGANWESKVGGIALLSFTNAAIREFHEATIKVEQRELLSDPNFIGTFDSFVERFIITPFGHLVSGLAKRPRLYIAPRPGDWKNTKLHTWSQLKNRKWIKVPAWEMIPFPGNGVTAFMSSKEYGGKALAFAAHNPIEEFFKLGLYTHQQRVYLAHRILIARPQIAKCISRRFPEVVIDEAQDTNIWLLILLDLLRQNGTKVTLVGDPDQCIYEFSFADAQSLTVLKTKWQIPEKPLSKSFRCNNPIAESVRNISGNNSFIGCGPNKNEHQRAFVIREATDTRFSHSIKEFERLLERAGISQSDSVILCRGHQQLETIRGEVSYTDLKGLTKKLAQAAFYRDARKDYRKAFEIVVNVIREMVDEPELWESIDNEPDSESSLRVRLALWKFAKSSDGLPPIYRNCTLWIENLKNNLTGVFAEIGITNLPTIGQKIKRTGLSASQLTLPLFEPQTLFPPIRQETIHQVKGESIDGVLVLGSAKFFNEVVKTVENDENGEERRLAYVAMTRARYALLVGLPASHFDKHIAAWKHWGFGVL